MKRIKILIITLTMVMISVSSVGCIGNYELIDLSFKFNKAYVKIGEEWQDIEISSWTDYEGEQIQLKLKDGTVLVLHSANCILYDGNLPKVS